MRKTIARRAVAGALTAAAVGALVVWSAGQAAAVGTPTGFGAGTTGGGNATPVTVTTASALISAIQSSSPAVVRVSGMIAISGMQRVAANKTVIGVGSGSGITGGGLNVHATSNVIIQNLNFSGSSDDAINVETSTRVWIDHNTLSNAHDGLIDIKHASDFVTVSWNKFSNHDKTMLLGHSDSNAAEDTGHLRVTYHHNWFNGTNQRHPRVRFGNPVHVYNNFYGGVTAYGVASTMQGGTLVEGNYFENTSDAFHCGEAASPPAAMVARNNTMVNSAGSTSACTGTVKAIPYSYTLDPSANVKSIVTSGAGVGKVA
jgi:pectate lyase